MGIEINNLAKTFGTKIALNIEHLQINKGELVGLVGNNGAGKTTLFRSMLNLIVPDHGTILMDGVDVARSEEWKDGCGAFIDANFLIDYLTPEEYFSFVGKLYGMDKKLIEQRLEEYKHLMSGEILEQKKYIRDFSAGNKQKVGIIGAMLAHPPLLVLDEPFNFLDPSSQRHMTKALENYCETNKATILVSSHNLSHVTQICKRILLLENGIVIRDIDNQNGEAERELENYFAQED